MYQNWFALEFNFFDVILTMIWRDRQIAKGTDRRRCARIAFRQHQPLDSHIRGSPLQVLYPQHQDFPEPAQQYNTFQLPDRVRWSMQGPQDLGRFFRPAIPLLLPLSLFLAGILLLH